MNVFSSLSTAEALLFLALGLVLGSFLTWLLCLRRPLAPKSDSHNGIVRQRVTGLHEELHPHPLSAAVALSNECEAQRSRREESSMESCSCVRCGAYAMPGASLVCRLWDVQIGDRAALGGQATGNDMMQESPKA